MSRLSVVLAGTIFISLVVFGSVRDGAAAEADAESGVTLQFGAAVSYVQDLNDPSGSAGLNSASYSSMEQDESFNIDLVQLALSGFRGRASYGAKLDFGDLAAVAGDSLAGDIALQEATLSYDFESVVATVGRVATPIGQEVLEPWGIANIGRSWSWQGQPINHDGITVSGAMGPMELMLGAVNNFTVSDPTGNDSDNDKGVIGSVGAALSDELNLYFAGIVTKFGDVLNQQMYNVIVSGELAGLAPRPLHYAIEGNYRNNDPDAGSSMTFWSFVLYGGVDFDATGLDIRFEYMDDDGIVLGSNTSLWGVTTTFSWVLTDGVVVRAEYRHDNADDPIFTDGTSKDNTLDTLQAQFLWFPEG